MIGGAPIYMAAPVYAQQPMAYAQQPMAYAPQGYPAQGRPVAVDARPPVGPSRAVAVDARPAAGAAPVYRGAMGSEPARPAVKRRAPAIPTPEELHVTGPGAQPAGRAVAR